MDRSSRLPNEPDDELSRAPSPAAFMAGLVVLMLLALFLLAEGAL